MDWVCRFSFDYNMHLHDLQSKKPTERADRLLKKQIG